MLKYSKDEQGFTLVEMVVVLVLVAVLSAIAVPIYRDWRKRARCAEAYNILGALVTSAMAYYEDTGSFTDFTIGSEDDKARYFDYAVTESGDATCIITATGRADDMTGAKVEVMVSATGKDIWNADENICRVPSELTQ